MFTGIVEETGTVESVHPGDQSIRLTLSLRKTGTGLKVGDSLSVNGCCPTVAELATKNTERSGPCPIRFGGPVSENMFEQL